MKGAAPRRPPGALLLHPVTLASLVTLVVNDQLVKRAWPGVVSGKLSDVAGMVLCPLVLHAGLELLAAKAGRAFSLRKSERALAALVVATLLGFTLVELTAIGDTAYRIGVGALTWPFQAVLHLVGGGGLPPLRPVRATPDPTDLLALPFGLVALRIGGPAPDRPRPLAASSAAALGVLEPGARRAVRVALLLGCLALLASSETTRNNFYALDAPPTTTELTPELTTRVYEVNIRAYNSRGITASRDAPFPRPVVYLKGTISSSGTTNGAPAPYVSYALLGARSTEPSSGLLALTSFELAGGLGFTGSCYSASGRSSTPCTSSFVVELSRVDDGANGGTVTVDWQLHFRSTGAGYDASGEHDLDWEITVEEM